MITFLVSALVLGGLFALWVAWIEPRRVVVRRFELRLAHLKSPLTAVVVGDIQPNSFHWPADRLEALFAKLQRTETPDLVLWLGDYYNAHTDLSKVYLDKRPKLRGWIDDNMPRMPEISLAMSKLSGRLGSFAVLGNHDWAWSGHETAQALKSAGITVLQDEIANVVDPVCNQKIQVLGYEDVSSGRRPDYDRVHQGLDASATQIGLSHSPDAFPAALGGPALMLSGHTHGGQIRFPFLGALVLPLEHRTYDWGWFSERHRRLYVTSGLGTSLPPLRLLCPPEVVVLSLVPGDEEA